MMIKNQLVPTATKKKNTNLMKYLKKNLQKTRFQIFLELIVQEQGYSTAGKVLVTNNIKTDLGDIITWLNFL